MLKKNNERKIFARKRLIRILIVLMSISLVAALVFQILNVHKNQQIKEFSDKSNKKYEPSTEEINYLANRFKELKAVNPETVAYVYAPGTQLDEPVVQTSDNATYLDKTFEGQHEPFMGTVFMDMDNHKDFSDRLTWLFGHARGSKAGDHRMFNDVNYYDRQDYFDKHRYVVIETPERKYYYQAMGLVIVPEETAFYRTEFKDDEDFTTQLRNIYEAARTKDPKIKIKASDRYVVLSTCREEDDTIRSNLYLRQIPDSELEDFLTKHGKELTYTPTR
ncbi:surface protein cell wall anchor [Streptococcus sanguinis SK49]|jgi:sortase, srtB family|uniref:Surface protein cell wall anchor n=1 Tax=Streptococcus sanguinis SK49 TaxID=888808 RepID=F3UUE5_STRSA|nr:class B sortase, LPKTxAVK-specific [Streptococcus sanguinis]EGJ41407.1 surface protein cell wall anchor [Streptococcus sanguinis SK49]